MATRNTADEELRAFQMIDALCGDPDDVDPDVPVDPEATRRMRANAERAFDIAWRAARAKARVDSEVRSARHDALLGISRDVLIDRVVDWQVRNPRLQLAHRDLATLTDDDLRTLLADIEEIAGRRAGAS
jgi:hypothetical protein